MSPPAKEAQIELAKAQAEYGSAMRELASVREALRKEGSSVELRRRLGAAEDRAARAAARISELRERSPSTAE